MGWLICFCLPIEHWNGWIIRSDFGTDNSTYPMDDSTTCRILGNHGQ